MVLCELDLPSTAGGRLVEHLQADRELSSIPVVLISDRRCVGAEARRLGAKLGVRKPLFSKQLAPMLALAAG